MCVDVIDVAWIDARLAQRFLDGAGGAARFRIGLGGGVGVEARTHAKHSA